MYNEALLLRLCGLRMKTRFCQGEKIRKSDRVQLFFPDWHAEIFSTLLDRYRCQDHDHRVSRSDDEGVLRFLKPVRYSVQAGERGAVRLG
jgi:hypothetical protein